MSAVELNDAFLARIAGWEVVKQARALLAGGRVLSSNWSPPVLKGVVQEGSTSYRAGLVIRDTINIENLCTCRASRDWGTLCIHSIAVGLHHLRRDTPVPPPDARTPAPAGPSRPPPRPASPLRFEPESAGGVPVELSIVFPPNLEAAIARGRVMLCLEARTREGRAPLNSLSRARHYAPSDPDRQLLDHLVALAEGELPGVLQLGADQLISLLPLLAGHRGLTLGRSQPVEVHTDPWPQKATVRLEPNGELTVRRLEAGAGPLRIHGGGATSWGYQKGRFAPLPPGVESDAGGAGVRTVPRREVPMFLNRDWPALQKAGATAENFSLDQFQVDTPTPRLHLQLAGGIAMLQAQLQAAYGPRIVPLGMASRDTELWIPDPDNPRRYWTRNEAAEQAAMGRLIRSGFTGPDSQGRYQLNGQSGVLNFFAREYPRLNREWTVTLEQRLERSCASNLEPVEPRFSITPSGVQWFDLSVSYQLGDGETLPAAEVQRLLRSGQNHARLKNGKFALFNAEALEEFQETLRDCNPEQHGDRYRVASRQAGFLESTVRQLGWQMEAPAGWRQKAKDQSGEAVRECPPLGGLEPVLRGYQKQGVAWFRFLRENGFGGILADEMGLGKTLQTLAFLDWLKAAGGRTGPHLVVCPTSLVYNWAHEARRFTPGLKVVEIQGAGRAARFQEIPDADLVLTSYALIRRDADRYRGLEFDTVVLDEAQHIKNRQTQNAQAVKAIRAGHRLVLTGTPMENSVNDLWSIFDFLMPGYLGTAQDFRERYEAPIAQGRDTAATARLARRLRPFLLRRLKQEVAADLPARLDQVSYCELSERQRGLYRQVLEAGRREMLEMPRGEEAQRGRMLVLTTLLRLRQICCDPRLLDWPEGTPPPASGKTELFAELLEEVLDGGHRVLVFSQFTRMLGLLREQLDRLGLDYCYLDGSTQDRAGVVERFQSGAAPVFLISLKAGGVGLNLTAADTVIHFDPWWNPAVEAQATDRAHRIGQTRVVTSYKLIARDTVEEKILTLQQRKRELTEQALGGEEAFTEALTWDEIRDLLG
jgi:superfamily II DNA or RNA helicase